MLDMRFIHSFNSDKVLKRTDRAKMQSLSRNAAYIRGVMRRMVKETKVKSKPGDAPRSHRKIFKASILFGLDGRDNAVIGPMKLMTGRSNRSGMPVPQILEEGGEVAPGSNLNWPYGRKGQPSGNSLNSIVDFVQRQGYGIIRWGYSVASLKAKAKNASGRGSYGNLSRGGSSGQYKTWSRYAPRKGKNVYMQNARIYSRAQAERSAKIIMELFGPPHVTTGNVRPRPLIGPALNQSKPALSGFWRDSARVA